MLQIIREEGVEIIKIDTDKMMEPGQWGWRPFAVDMRMPNGQLVEFYSSFTEMIDAQDTTSETHPIDNHKLFEKWRNVSESEKTNNPEYQKDVDASYAVYQEAWEAGLKRAGYKDDAAASASFAKAVASLGSVTRTKSSSSSSAEGTPSDQTPSEDRRIDGNLAPSNITNADESRRPLPTEKGNLSTDRSSKNISSPDDIIPQEGDTKPTQTQPRSGRDLVRASLDRVRREKAAADAAKKQKDNDDFGDLDDLLGVNQKSAIEPEEQPFFQSKYEKFKPALEKAFGSVGEGTPNERVDAFINKLNERYPIDALEQLEPYLVRFVEDYILTATPNMSENNDVEATDDFRRKQTDEDGQGRDAGEGSEDVRGTDGGRHTEQGGPRESERRNGDAVSDGERSDQSDRDGADIPHVSRTDTETHGTQQSSDADSDRASDGVSEGRRERRRDYLAPEGSLTREGSWRQAAENNLNAIELAKKIESEDRAATPEEQAILAKFVGWGASELANNAFREPTAWGMSPEWKKIAERMREVMTPEEIQTARRSTQYAHYTSEQVIRGIWSALNRFGFQQGTILEPGMGIGLFPVAAPKVTAENSSYTGVEMDAMTARIAKLLLPDQTVLPTDFTKQRIPANHFDVAIGNPPFSKTVVYADRKYSKLKLRLHDYFFAKSLDSVRPGGLLAFVTSNGTMDKKNNAARAYLAESADLLGAIRLPQTAFKQNAGTEVVTDVLFFRKRMAGEEPSGVKWLGLAEVTAKNEWGADVTGLINEYFVDHPEMVLGEHSFTGSMYASDSYTVVPKEGDIEAQFLEAVDNLPKAVFAKQAQAADTATKAAERDWSITAKKEGSLYIHDDGRLMIVDGGSGIELSATKKIPASHLKMLKDYVALRNALKQAQYDQLHAEDDPAIKIAEAKADIEKQLAESGGTKERAIERFGRMNDLDLMRTITQHAMKIGASPKQYATALSDVLGRDYITMWPVENELSAWEVSLAALNKEYDAFVKKHGNILEFTEREVTKSDEDGNLTTNVIRTFKKDNILRNDIESALVKALERVTDDGTIEKGAPLLGRQIKPPAPPKIENLNDALMVSLDTLGHLNLDHVAELVRPIQEMTREDVIAALGDAIYEEPGGGGRYVMADEYLSGNVREKLELAEAAASDKRFRRNVEALRKVQPLPLAAEKISIQLGATWVPAEHVSEFAKQVLGLKGETLQRRGQHGSAVYFDPATNRWTVPEAHGSGARNARSATAEYGTEHRSPAEILEAALNDQSVTITSTDEHGKKYPNKDAIAAVRAKIEKMNQAFRPWLFSDAARGKALVSLYNEKLNVMAPREFNGSHLTTPGLSVKFKLHPHVKRGIWRIIQTGNTYLAHAVGAGKTLQMIASAMEQKRLGLISKPMFVVPRHMLQQFSSEFLQAYPLANIMVADEESFHTDNRRQFVARAALNDLDGIIITHSAFGLLRTRPESSSSVLDELLADMHFELDRLTTGVTGDGKRVGDSMQDTRTIKQIEQRIEAIEQKFFGRMNASRDNVVDFEDLGVDFLYVDEAHEFRKLDFVTNQTNIKGIDPQGSMRALDLMVKSRWLDQQRPGRSLVMASGTPITNTMAELYTIQRFFDPHGLAANTLSHFDAWAKEFGQIEENVEPNAAGGYRLVKRFSKFVNTGILMQHVRSFMDVITLGQLQGLIKIPSIRTNTEGKAAPQVVITERYPELEAYLKGPLSDRITASEAWKPSPSEPNNPDPMIAIIADGQLAAFDMRFIYPSLPSNPASKLNRLADGIIDSYHAYNDIEYTNPSTGEPYPIKGAAHIVFSYSGFGDQVAKNRGFNARQWLRKRLTEGGIPNNEIAFISDYKTTSAKAALFKEVREGKKKILIGSPKNMGTGVNAQLRLKTLHYGVAPWYPADIEQPHGRILRHGNQNPEVEVNWYAAKGTYDEAQWGMLARKSKAIEDAMTGKFDGDIEDVSESSQYAMASALASGDPRALRLAELRGVVEKYSRLEQAYHASQSGLRADLRDFNSGVSNNSISWNEQQLKRHEDAIAIAPSEKVDRENFTIQIGKKAFTPSEDVKVTDIGKTLQDAWRREVQRFTKEAVESRALQRGTVATVFGKHEVRASVWADGHSIKSDLAIYIGDVCISLTDLSVKPTDIDNVSSSGLITRIYNAFNGLGDAVKDRAAKIEKLKQQRAATEEALRKPFEFEDELNNARAELNQLGMEMAGVDLAIPPDTITADELKELADDYNLHDDKGDVDEPTLKSAVPLNDTSSEGSGLDANGNLMPEAAKGIAEERANIEKGAKADGTWLKAPNGDTSKLTPHQWIDSRTTRFKRWFGDWELGAKTTSIVTAARHTFTDLQDAARWAKTHITGTYRNKETGHRIIVSGNAISKYLSEKAVAQSSSMPYHLATLRVLPDLIRNAILIETHADASGNARVAEMQRYYAAVRIAGDLRRVELTVRAFKSGDTRHYSYEVTQIKTLGGSLAESVEANASNRTPSVTMATLLQGAKKNNGETFDTLASKAIDANGEPLVVYRGDVKANDGIFYTSSPAIAEGYTRSTFFRGGTEPQTTAAFLSLHNPLVIDAKGTRNDNIPVPWSEWKPKTFGNLPKSAVSVA
ncbi:MAG: N-6 DNA methylase [Pyrinomonadaceae bacterium]|nr:N-6 DNA methylase [Pyrinomonadaceae bacterium]